MKTTEQIEKMFGTRNKNTDYVADLYLRWLDEKEYEDIEDYALAFSEHFKIKDVIPTKEPFGFKFKCKYNVMAHVYCKNKGKQFSVSLFFKVN